MNKLNVFGYGYYSWRAPFSNIGAFFRNIKYAYQRVTRGFCDYDAWDLDHYYTELIAASISYMRKNLHSYPPNMTFKEWEDILFEIQEHFEKANDTNSFYENPYRELFFEILKTGSSLEGDNEKLIRKNYYKIEEKNRELRAKELQEGLTMLLKYFRDLWD
jgi:hypothetical protein